MLSTHDLPRICYHAEDNALWCNVSWTCYWEKSIWILPIHRPSPAGHWVICIVKFSSKQLLLFDSLVEQRPWKHNIKVICYFSVVVVANYLQDIIQLIAHLSLIASKRLGISRDALGC